MGMWQAPDKQTMRSRGKCSGSGRRAALRRSNDGTVLVGCGHRCRGLRLRRVLLQIGELQLELVQKCAPLGRLSELLMTSS